MEQMKYLSKIFCPFVFILLLHNYANGQCWKQMTVGNMIIAVKDDGTLWGWGTNTNAQLGLGFTSGSQKALQIGTDNDWDTVMSCQNTTLARKIDGSLWGWGLNGDAELGIGMYGVRSSPILVSSTPGWRAVSSSAGAFYVAIKADGTIWGWGENSHNQLGFTTPSEQTTPAQISSLTDWKKIACGFNHVIALKTDGTLWGWGNNQFNEVSNAATPNIQPVPIQIGTANNWADVSAGANFSIAVKTDGTLWTWGINGDGQLGVGDQTTHTTQVQVGTATDWMSVFAGVDHAIAAKTDSTLWGWGRNSTAALGYTSPVIQTSPASLGFGNIHWKLIAPGFRFTTILKTDNSIWASGMNNWDLLGVGTVGGNITSFKKAGPMNYAPYVPALGGGSSVLASSCDSDYKGYFSFGDALTLNRRLLAIDPKGNNGSFSITYDSSRNTNSSPLLQTNTTHATSLMGRLVTVTYSGSIASGNGISLRFYYSASDSTNSSNALDPWISTHPGTIKRWAWVKYEGDATTTVANQQPDGFSGTFKIGVPDTSGSENGLRFAEFRGLRNFSTFAGFAYANITNSAFINQSLPVTISQFSAYPQGTTSLLRWTTNSESNNKGFFIERSNNSLDWQLIGSVSSLAPNGNSTTKTNYSFTDHAPKTEKNFYRLKQEDRDGKFSYSSIELVTFKDGQSITIFPNPAKEVFYLSGMKGGETVSIYSLVGSLIRTEKIPGRGTYHLPLGGVSKGTYLVKVYSTNNETRNFRLIVE